MAILPNPSKALVKPVYGVDSYGTDLSIQFGMDSAATINTFTISGATFRQSNDAAGTIFNAEDIDIFISDTNTGYLEHEGDDTDYDRTFEFRPDMTAWVYKTEIWLPIVLNCSAFTSGSVNFVDARLIITEDIGDGNRRTIYDQLKTPAGDTGAAFSNLAATNALVWLTKWETLAKYKLNDSRDIRFQLIINTTQAASSSLTYQVGIAPISPFVATAVAKKFTVAAGYFHVHASLDHAFPVMRDQDVNQIIDYSGVNWQGESVAGT